MIHKAFSILMLASFMFAMVACNEDLEEESPVAVFVTPSADSISVVESGESVKYDLSFFTNHNGFVNKLTITSFNSESGILQLLDEDIPSDRQTYKYVYTAPNTPKDSLGVELTFKVCDDRNNSTTVTRKLIIKNSHTLLPEVSNIVLHLSDLYKNALSFTDPTQTFCSVDEENPEMVDMYVTTETNGTISLKSMSKSMFIRNNSFNYSSATAVALQTVYENSIREYSISDLAINDIILVGHGNQAQGVLFVSNIITTGYENTRCIQIFFKRLK